MEAQLWRSTREKYEGQFELVRTMCVRQKRHIFMVLRQCGGATADTFLPSFGLHCGEFACFQILAEHSRKECKDGKESREGEP